MVKLSLSTPLFALALAAGTHAAIGPVANLVITDKTVSPDGFARAAVVANGGTPGPLIVGNKVWGLPNARTATRRSARGLRFLCAERPLPDQCHRQLVEPHYEQDYQYCGYLELYCLARQMKADVTSRT